MALAESSHQTYWYGQRKFTQFCKEQHFSYPVTEYTLGMFTTYMPPTLSYRTIKVYLAAVRFHQIELGYPDNFSRMQRLCLLRGIKRIKGISKHLPRSPITITILRLLKTTLNQTTLCNYDKHMLWAAFTLAFFGFLRSADFCSRQVQCYDCHSTLLKSDLSLHQASMSIHIKVSKTDPFRNGTNLVVCAMNTSVCAVRAMTHYPPHRRRGRYLTRNSLTSMLRYLLSCVSTDTNQFSSYSFRMGAAITAAAAGVPD